MAQNSATGRKSTWLKALIAVTLLTFAVWLLLVYYHGFSDESSSQDKRGFSRKLQCGISETHESWAQYFRSLPSDEEMIANFRKHRADFERLAQIYREDPSGPICQDYLEPTPELKAIMARINVAAIRGDDQLWIPPNPYSREAFDSMRALEQLPNCAERRRFSGVIFRYSHGNVTHRGIFVSKQYYYFPLAPRIGTNSLILPVGRTSGSPIIIAQTLNTFPPDLEPYESACRQIDSHWYIQLWQNY
jgi:hypothetical protein